MKPKRPISILARAAVSGAVAELPGQASSRGDTLLFGAGIALVAAAVIAFLVWLWAVRRSSR